MAAAAGRRRGHPARHLARRHERLGDSALLRREDPDAIAPRSCFSAWPSQRPVRACPPKPKAVLTKPVEEDALLDELARVLCGPGEKARILVVEDDVDLARVIADVFTPRHHRGARRPHTPGGSRRVLRFQPAPDGSRHRPARRRRIQRGGLARGSTKISPTCRWWSTPAAIWAPKSASS